MDSWVTLWTLSVIFFCQSIIRLVLIYSGGKSQMQMHIDTRFLIETPDLIIFFKANPR